jgi:hypothetical protein
VHRARYYLPPAYWVGPTVTPIVEEDLRPVVGLDDALEVGQEGSITATMWVVGASELSGDASLAAPLGQEEELALGVIRASQIRAPTSRVGEPDAIKGLQPQST